MTKRNLKLEKGKLELKDEFELIYEKTITKFGNGAKIDAPKEFLGKKVYVVVRKQLNKHAKLLSGKTL